MTKFKYWVIRFTAAAAAVVAAVGLGACGHDTQQTKREVYLNIVHNRFPQTNNPRWNHTLVSNAHIVCKALNRGVSGQQIRDTFVAYAANQSQAALFGYVVGAGVKVYCPQYTAEITR